jgi:NAD(P)-dependent dehydrogenase (short-subunit alcohol dehydrogenase family)
MRWVNANTEEGTMSGNDTQQDINLAGQVAIVTGGGRGIGRAMALGLANAGAAVAVVARSADQLAETVTLIERAGGRAIPATADVTDQQAVERAVAETERQLGPVDLLVNNAGIGHPFGPIWESDPVSWWRCIEVNLRGPYLCSRAVLPGMVARHRGRIITTASGAGLGSWPNAAAYAIGKCAAIRFSENLAAETTQHGISVFVINPGFVHTDMVADAAESPDDEKWFGGFFRKSLAAGRDVPPERAADLVALLASGQADALSGCFISVSDDVPEMVSRADEIRADELHRLRLRT